MQIAVSFAFVSISFVLLQAATGDNLDTVRAMWLVTGVVFLVTFNGLGKLPKNSIKWLRSANGISEENAKLLNRFGGYLGCSFGMCMILMYFSSLNLSPMGFVALILVFVAALHFYTHKLIT